MPITPMPITIRTMILTPNTSTSISTTNPRIKTFTILFLTLRFFTSTSFKFSLNIHCHLFLIPIRHMLMIIKTSITSTFNRTFFSSIKTFTISLQTISLTTITSLFPFLLNNFTLRLILNILHSRNNQILNLYLILLM